MQDLDNMEIEQVGGGLMYMDRFGVGAAMIGIGCLALAVAPFAISVGAAAAIGMGTAGGVLTAGGNWLISAGR